MFGAAIIQDNLIILREFIYLSRWEAQIFNEPELANVTQRVDLIRPDGS